jgi:hypothetical protein
MPSPLEMMFVFPLAVSILTASLTSEALRQLGRPRRGA